MKTAGRFSLNAASASGMSAVRVSSAWPRFSSSSAAAYDEISRFACSARLDSCTPPGEFATIHQMDCRDPNVIYTAEINDWRSQKILLKPQSMKATGNQGN